eukprot:scaffold279817_cov32-Tisochrysis_lutea.AAC.2
METAIRDVQRRERRIVCHNYARGKPWRRHLPTPMTSLPLGDQTSQSPGCDRAERRRPPSALMGGWPRTSLALTPRPANALPLAATCERRTACREPVYARLHIAQTSGG